MSRGLVFAFGVLSILLAGCPEEEEPETRPWRFEIEEFEGSDAIELVDATIHAGTCGDVPAAADRVYQSVIRRDAVGVVSAVPPRLAAGNYAFRGHANNSDCETLAYGCTDVVVPGREEVVVRLEFTVPILCKLKCMEGFCSDTVLDAGPPLPDAGPEDAGPPFDAGPVPDAGPLPDGGPPPDDAGPVDGGGGCGTCGPDERCDGTGCVLADSVIDLSAGGSHACALRFDGALFCWGGNGGGQLGDGTNTERHSPVAVSGTTRWTDVTAGFGFTCAIDTAAQLWCWGNNASGQLATGDDTSRNVPTRVLVDPDEDGTVDITGWTDVSVMSDTTCGIDLEGDVWCWGDDYQGRVGDGLPAGPDYWRPHAVTLPSRAVDLFQTHTHQMVRLADGSVWCWGSNVLGQCGLGFATPTETTEQIPAPMEVPGTWREGSGGYGFTCLVAADGTVSCVGRNNVCELARGFCDPMERVTVAPITGMVSGVRSLSSGRNFSLAVAPVAGGTGLFCWGYNYNFECGIGAMGNRSMPVMQAGTDWAFASGGDTFACAVRTSGELLCWGSNANGRTGVGVTAAHTTRPAPVTIPEAP